MNYLYIVDDKRSYFGKFFLKILGCCIFLRSLDFFDLGFGFFLCYLFDKYELFFCGCL